MSKKKRILKKDVGEKQYQFCIGSCSKNKIDNKDLICKDTLCLIRHKKIHTRRINIKKSSTWKEIELKLTNNPINERDKMYLTCEALVKSTYDFELVEYAAKILIGRKTKNKDLIIKEIHKLSEDEIRLLLDKLIVKSLGYERAKEIVNIIGGESS